MLVFETVLIIRFCGTEHALPTLFKKYMQVSADHARKYGGTGLGLAICKQLVSHSSCQLMLVFHTFSVF